MSFLFVAALSTAVPTDSDGAPLVVKVVGSGPSVWTIVTAVAAIASPLVSLLVARYVTSRTLRGARAQQLLERQLVAASDFAAVAHAATSELRALDPRRRAVHPSTGELTRVGTRVEEARHALGLINLLFRGETEPVAEKAGELVSALASARRAGEVVAGDGGRDGDTATREAELISAVRAAEDAYAVFLDAAGAATDPAPADAQKIWRRFARRRVHHDGRLDG
jgi:hypothetical protein